MEITDTPQSKSKIKGNDKKETVATVDESQASKSHQKDKQINNVSDKTSTGSRGFNISASSDDDDPRDDEDEDDNIKIIEMAGLKERWAKRNIRCARHAPGVSGSYLAIDQKIGKDVIWNEIILLEDKNNDAIVSRFTSIMKRLNRKQHPNMVRYLDYWIRDMDEKKEKGHKKLVYITERTEEGTLKQFMSNTRNKTIWRRCMANLLSVLKFMLEIGLTHGNLTSETIHYQQKSGNLKVGTIAMDDVLNPKATRARSKFVNAKQSVAPEYLDPSRKITIEVDVYAIGLIALELAVWEPKDDLIDNPEERIQGMLKRIKNPVVSDFIKGCFHPDPQLRYTWWQLYSHRAMFMVPRLELFAARCIASYLPPVVDHEALQDEIDVLLDKFDDDPGLVVVDISAHNISRKKCYKDFVFPTLNTKFIEDVKNGFHLIFGFGNKDEVHVFEKAQPVKRPKETVTKTAQSSGNGTKDLAMKLHDFAQDLSSESEVTPVRIKDRGAVPLKPETAVEIKYIHKCSTWPCPFEQCNVETCGELPDTTVVDHAQSHILSDTVDRDAEEEVDGLDDEDEDEEIGAHSVDTRELQRLHGPPPQDKQENLQFLDIKLLYIGLGRWNFHFKVWFKERHIRREVNVQLTEDLYSQPRGIADRFVDDQICGAQDKDALTRRIIFAYLGHPTVDGQIQDYNLLCKKLDWIHESTTSPDTSKPDETLVESQPSSATKEVRVYDVNGTQSSVSKINFSQMDSVSSAATASGHDSSCQTNDTAAAASYSSPPGHKPVIRSSNSNASDIHAQGFNNNACEPSVLIQSMSLSHDLDINILLDKLKDLHRQKLEDEEKEKLKEYTYERICGTRCARRHKTGDLAVMPPDDDDDSSDSEHMLLPVEIPLNEVHWGCGPTCKSYRECRWHDRCDYLNNQTLPPYLTSRCYHCREQHAREEGIDPFTLWFMHSHHQVPYPYFLQARFGYPTAQVTAEEIAYECRYRNRRPCRCTKDKKTGKVIEMPPCTEFPEDYLSDDESVEHGERNGHDALNRYVQKTALSGASVTSKCWITQYIKDRQRRKRRNSTDNCMGMYYRHHKYNSF